MFFFAGSKKNEKRASPSNIPADGVAAIMGFGAK